MPACQDPSCGAYVVSGRWKAGASPGLCRLCLCEPCSAACLACAQGGPSRGAPGDGSITLSLGLLSLSAQKKLNALPLLNSVWGMPSVTLSNGCTKVVPRSYQGRIYAKVVPRSYSLISVWNQQNTEECCTKVVPRSYQGRIWWSSSSPPSRALWCMRN